MIKEVISSEDEEMPKVSVIMGVYNIMNKPIRVLESMPNITKHGLP